MFFMSHVRHYNPVKIQPKKKITREDKKLVSLNHDGI